MTITHKNLKRFYLNGEIADDSIIPRIKIQYIELLKNAMRCKGYVIRYDIDPDFTLSYNGRSFDFELSIYGVFVGRKKAQWISGVDKNRIIENTTRQNKSDESCSHAASI
jgi:hypothetical protein